MGEADGGGEEVFVDVLVADGEGGGAAKGVVVGQDGDLEGFRIDGNAAALDGEVVRGDDSSVWEGESLDFWFEGWGRLPDTLY